MFRRDYLSWWFRPRFLRPGGRRSHTLFAGPWVGEFGWELMNWQGFVRKLSRHYSRTIVCCRQGNEALYGDFAQEFVFHDIRGTADCNRVLRVENPEELQRVNTLVPARTDHLRPLGYQPFHRQEFVQFGKKSPDLAVDILFHPRGRAHGADRNWDADKWTRLISSLRSEGMTLGCIGLKDATLDLDAETLEFHDWRDLPLSRTLDILASARLLLGPSSGPMHLAALCGTPHLVWTDKAGYARGRTNRDKYEQWWNPLRTSTIVLDAEDFQPKVSTVLEATLQAVGKSNGAGIFRPSGDELPAEGRSP